MTTPIECPICKSQALEKSTGFDGQDLNCQRCGKFLISSTALMMWKANTPNLRQVANVSGWLREHQNTNINSSDIESLLSISAPSVAERAIKILLEINRLNIDLSYSISVDLNDSAKWLGCSYSDNSRELRYLLQTYLVSEVGYISLTDTNTHLLGISITPKGYKFLESLKNTHGESRIGFCAMWFDQRVLPIWTDAISPAINAAGYDPKRIDTHQHNNRIDDEIIAMIRRSKFVVADFVGNRAGVYFEAGFALGLGLPVIWTCNRSKLHRIHFDNRQYNFVTWEWGKLDEFKYALQNRIEATLGHGSLQ